MLHISDITSEEHCREQRVGHGTYIHSCQLKTWKVAVVHKVQAKNCKVFWLTKSNVPCAVCPLC